jgi:hypothetical protein
MTMNEGLRALEAEANAANATVEDVAQLLAAPKRSVYGWLRGHRAPRGSRAPKLRAALEGTPAPWLSDDARARVVEAWDAAPPPGGPRARITSCTRRDGVLELTVRVEP